MAKIRDIIKLTIDLPISYCHGCTEGREFEVIRTERRGEKVFIGDMGIECTAFSHEYHIVSKLATKGE